MRGNYVQAYFFLRTCVFNIRGEKLLVGFSDEIWRSVMDPVKVQMPTGDSREGAGQQKTPMAETKKIMNGKSSS